MLDRQTATIDLPISQSERHLNQIFEWQLKTEVIEGIDVGIFTAQRNCSLLNLNIKYDRRMKTKIIFTTSTDHSEGTVRRKCVTGFTVKYIIP